MIAKYISYLLHPLLMPTYGITLIFNINSYLTFVTPYELKKAVYIITFVSTFLLPASSSYLLLARGYIKNLSMESFEERRLPFLLAATFYSLGYFLCSLLPLPAPIRLMLLGANLTVIIALIINLKWKISVHMIGIGGILGAIIGLSYRLMIDLRFEITLLILCVGIVGYARLRLKAHDPSQVYAGFLLGVISELFLLVFF